MPIVPLVTQFHVLDAGQLLLWHEYCSFVENYRILVSTLLLTNTASYVS